MRDLPTCCLRSKQNSVFICDPCKKEFKTKSAILQHLHHPQKEEIHTTTTSFYKCTCSTTSTWRTRDDFVEHLQSSKIHISSLHNLICVGNCKEAKPLYRNKGNIDLKCSSHDVAEDEDQNVIGGSPLHCAILNKFTRCASDLLNWGANPNIKDEFGWTPLHMAAARGNVKILLKLLSKDGNLFEPNNERETPYDIAKSNVKQQILQELFYFKNEDGAARVTGMKTPFLAEKVIKQFQEFKKDTVPALTSSPPTSGSFTSNDIMGRGDNENDLGDQNQNLYQGSSKVYTYDEIFDKPNTKQAYQSMIDTKKEKITHGKILVLGQVGSGKSCLVRNLSGKEFDEKRVETEGIDCCFVNSINLDESWKEVESEGWPCDEAIARNMVEWLLQQSAIDGPTTLSEGMQSLAICSSPTSDAMVPFPTEDKPPSIATPVKDKIVKQLMHPGDRSEQFILTIWDFAGHDIYQTMHHIFLSAKAMYVICFDLSEFKKDREKTLGDVRFWLNSIATHKLDSNPAVFIVSTHIDCEDEDTFTQANEYFETELFKFPAFSRFFVKNSNTLVYPIDNTKGPEDKLLQQLQAGIKKEALHSKDCSDEMYLRWLVCEKYLHGLTHEDTKMFSKTKDELRIYLESFDEYKKKKFEEKDFQEMLEAFHHSGFLWLPELLVKNIDMIGDLSNLVILNVQHLMDAMSEICLLCRDQDTQDRHFRQIVRDLKENAKISHSALKKILEKCDAPTDQMIELLKIFNILLPAEKIQLHRSDVQFEEPRFASTPDKSKPPKADECYYVIPSLLEDRKLDEEWTEACEDCEQWPFFIDFFEFVPPAVFHQLLVQIAEHSIQYASASPDPILSKFDAIFGFSDQFMFRLEFIESACQVKGSLRADCLGKPGKLLMELKDILTCICENFFRYQKFKIGPPCPKDNCPGSKPDGAKKKRNYGDVEDGTAAVAKRVYVYDLNPEEPELHFCLTKKVNGYEEFERWMFSPCDAQFDLTQTTRSGGDLSSNQLLLQSTSVDSGMSDSMSTGSATCLVDKHIRTQVSEELGDSWIDLARNLDFSPLVSVDAKIDNIRADYSRQVDRAYRILEIWYQDQNNDATVERLNEALKKCGRSDLANNLRRFSFSRGIPSSGK